MVRLPILLITVAESVRLASLHCIVSRNQPYSGVDLPLLTGGIYGGVCLYELSLYYEVRSCRMQTNLGITSDSGLMLQVDANIVRKDAFMHVCYLE